jgi:hypothetical protein
MKPGILNLSKWVEKTVQAVRHICIMKQAPCVGFSLVFFDPLAQPEERWNYVIELAYDPSNPPSHEERKRLEQAFELISEGIRRVMSDEESEEDFEDCSQAAQWH